MAKLGFLGTGTLAEAVIRGLQRSGAASAHEIFLSPRSEARSRALAAEFGNVTRLDSNEEVIKHAEILCLGLLPKQVADLKGLPFRAEQTVVSFLAGVPLSLIGSAVHPAQDVVRMLPLPCIEIGSGAILMLPGNQLAQTIFGSVGDIVVPADEAEMEILGAATGLMSAYFAQQNRAIGWMEERGVARPTAARYVRALYAGLSDLGRHMDQRGDPLPPEEYETQGGINQAARQFLQAEGWFETFARGMDRIVTHRATLMRPKPEAEG
ncbi:pyrroline-5-carboxylate reductase [Acidisoma sp. C75]